MITGALKMALPGGAAETIRALDHLALRIATNREIAGVHYKMDTDAGICAARWALTQLATLSAGSAFKTLVGLAAGELTDHKN